jgi:hypothetical protein
VADFNRYESAKFAQASDQMMDKLTDTVEKTLADSAARGFHSPAGDALMTILGASLEAKGAITEANGKIYEERSQMLFQIDEFFLNYLVKVAKLAMDLYREKLMNALAIEAAELTAETERSHADVSRMNSETEARMVAIIRNRAEMEARILVYKRQLIDAQRLTLGAETALVQAQLQTAEKKLEIIDSIYEVLAAEKIVLAAEQRRAAALEEVLAAELIVGEIKKSMIPFYLQKATARMALAEATKEEIPILKAIVELGYDRIDLQIAEEAEKHAERGQELEMEISREAYTRASAAEEFAKKQLQRILLEYGNDIRALILDQKKQLGKDEIDLKFSSALAREKVDIDNEAELLLHDRANLLMELRNILLNMELRALDEQDTVLASATTAGKNVSDLLMSRSIREGFIVG